MPITRTLTMLKELARVLVDENDNVLGGGNPIQVGGSITTSGTVTANAAITLPTSYNLTLTLANTEYSQALPMNCRFFEIQARTAADVRYAFVTGKVAGSTAPYHTLKANDYYSSPVLNQGVSPSTLFLASGTAGTVVEILAWT